MGGGEARWGMGGGGMGRNAQGGGGSCGVPNGGNGNFNRGTNFNRGNGAVTTIESQRCNWNWKLRRNWNRWNGGWGWGWAIGPCYWGFGSPYWYGGYPFWYDTLAGGAYVNPYYTNADDYGGYDYGVPIQQGQNQPSQNQPSQNDPGSDDDPHFAAARAAFYAGNYQEALREATQAVADMPTSGRDSRVSWSGAVRPWAIAGGRQAQQYLGSTLTA